MGSFRCLLPSLFIAIFACAVMAQDDAALRLEPVAVFGDARFRHAGSITHIAPLSDGQRALSTARDGSVRLWDLEDGCELRRYTPAKGEDVWNLLLLPGEREFLSCGEDNVVTRWNLATGAVVERYKLSATVMRLALVPGANQFIACDSGKLPSLWDMNTTQRLRRFKGHGDAIYSAIVSPDAKMLITGSEDGSIRAWELETGKSLWTIDREEEPEALDDLFGEAKPAKEKPEQAKKPPGPGHHADVFTVCFLPGGKQFASCSADQHVALWNAADGKLVWKFALPDSVKVIAGSPDGQRLAATCDDDHIYLLGCTDGEQLQAIKVPGGAHWPVTWSVDGKRLLSGGDGIIHQWDAVTGEQLFPAPTNNHAKGSIDRIAVSPKGDRLYATGDDDVVYVWDINVGKQIATWPAIEDASILQASADGKWLLVAASDQILIMETAGGKQRHRIAIDNTLRCAALADGGNLVVGTDWNGQLSAWGTTDGRLRYTQQAVDDNRDVDVMVVSSDGQRLITAGEEFVDIRKVSDGSPLARFAHNNGGSPGAAAVLGDDRALLIFNEDNDAPQLAVFLRAAGQQDAALSPVDVHKLSAQLGDDDFAQREQAMQQLVRGGLSVLANLPREDPDSEVRWRLAKVRDNVREGLIPTMPTDRVKLPRRVRAAIAHPRQSQWAMLSGRGSQAGVALGRLNGQTIELGEAASDGHSPACLAFSPDGRHLYTGNRDGTLSRFAVPQAE